MVTIPNQRSNREIIFDGVREIAKGKALDVKINFQRLFELARTYSELPSTDFSKLFGIPKWAEPVFPEKAGNDTMGFMLLGNAINFAFNDFKTGKKYVYEYKNIPWAGAFGMWAALKSAMDRSIPILDGEFLSKMDEKTAEEIFNKDSQIPMLKERVQIL